jgi:hypothetical protein
VTRADVEWLLAEARQSRERKKWTAALSYIEQALAIAARAKASDVLDAVVNEIERFRAANPPGEHLLRKSLKLRDRALSMRSQADTDPLERRLHRLLELLVYRRDDVAEGAASLSAFAHFDQNDDVRIDVMPPFSSWGRVLRQGYDRGSKALPEINMSWFREARLQIERTLRSTAAELVLAGAHVRGLANDAIPIIAFALLHQLVPVGADAAASPLARERADNAVIAVAEVVAELPPRWRAAFTDLYRLAFLLGVAQFYGEQANLRSLPVDS